MQHSKKSDAEVLEQINMLVAMICIAAAVGCAALASHYIFPGQPTYLQVTSLLSLIARVMMIMLTVILIWKYRLIKHLPFSTLIAGRKVTTQDDGYMEIVISRAMTNSWLAIILALMFFIFFSKTSLLPAGFYLLALLAIATAGYGISYIVIYLREAKIDAEDTTYE